MHKATIQRRRLLLTASCKPPVIELNQYANKYVKYFTGTSIQHSKYLKNSI